MSKPKVSPLMITLEEDELKELYSKLCEITNIEVKYSEDQIQMANEAIRKMKKTLDMACLFLYNKIY